MKRRARIIFDGLMFRPSLVAIFANPFYIFRRNIYKAIGNYAGFLGGRVLDFGCGRSPYRNIISSSNYVRLDFPGEGHSHSGESIDVFYGGKNIPFSDAVFDGILASEVLEHVFDIDHVLDELFRVIRPGGVLLATVPFAWGEHEIPNDFARYTSYAMKYLLEKSGFEVVEIKKTGGYIETISQLFSAYIFLELRKILGKFAYLLVPFLVAPINIIGVILGFMLPKSDVYFGGLVVVARRVVE